MIYKTSVIDNVQKTKKMAAAIEEKANEMAQSGWEFVSFSVTGSSKAILIFRHPGDPLDEESVPEPAALDVSAETVGEET